MSPAPPQKKNKAGVLDKNDFFKKLMPNFKNLSHGLNLKRGLNMVGST